ncbi:DUF460 domain-containing protein [Candidatus Woesearchaeota archaeon]|nr:DUF460 domain-containing protein [Candidatus Woesearchaeota archaeon]
MTGYKHLIIGLDPGTTTAYAILDINGRLITVKSAKELKLDTIIKETIRYGKPLIIGTDRKKCPNMISKYAAKTGAVKSIPAYDLSETEKNHLTKGRATRNAHEKDALAAAITAHKQYEPLLKRVDKLLKKERKEEDSEKVKGLVITNRISIKKALESINKVN